MLIRFSVENYLSYKDRQVFSMIAGKQTKHRDHVFDANGKRVLKGTFFFGANASGKSNLFKAVCFARDIALKGVRGNTLTNCHFRIDRTYAKMPGVFQFDIFTNGHFYSYGFAVSYEKGIIEEEWLYLCDASEIAVFERSIEGGKTVVKTDLRFSDRDQERNYTVFSENVPDDKPLLLEISERRLIEHEDFSAYRDVMQWIKGLLIIFPSSRYRNKIDLLSEEDSSFDLGRLLNSFDTGIEGITSEETDIEDALDFLPVKLREDIIQDVEKELFATASENAYVGFRIRGQFLEFRKKDNQIVTKQLMMDHGNADDLFELSDESDGTQRLFDLVPVLRADRAGRVILVDELDRSFHTKLVQQFIQLFYETTNGAGCQLIASVHDSNVMDLELLRQDEIWFVERKPDHSSQLYSLNKFQERFDKKIEKDYLLGRYGAIPCFSQLEAPETE